MEMKEKILQGASDLFHRYGIRSVSMDDLARSLSVSKKTIYQYFRDKDEIVELAMKLHLQETTEDYVKVRNEAKDPVEQLTKMSHCMRRHFREINPSLLYDIQKFHQRAWQEFNRFKNEFIREQIEENLKKGIEMGFYRSGINVEVLSILRIEEVRLALDPEIYPIDKYDFRDTQIQMLDHFINGIVTPKGKELFDKYTNEQQQTENHRND